MGQIGKGRGGEGWNQTWRQDAGRQTRGNTRSNRHTHTPRPQQVQPTEIRPTNIYSPQPSKSQGLPYYLLSLPLWLGLRPPCIQRRIGKASVQVQASGQGRGPRRRVGPFRSLQVLVRKHSPSLSWVGQSLRGLGWAFKVLGVPGPEGIPNPVQSTPCPTLIRLIFFLVQPVGTRLLLISRTPLA